MDDNVVLVIIGRYCSVIFGAFCFTCALIASVYRGYVTMCLPVENNKKNKAVPKNGLKKINSCGKQTEAHLKMTLNFYKKMHVRISEIVDHKLSENGKGIQLNFEVQRP
uniref:Neur_chan_memb domain-containing protein n=1 Tax=Rhabditophanes sp. KR3021 TaxID=114890 RepID=A0AC35U942_9BILA